jgi:hypothetical protein
MATSGTRGYTDSYHQSRINHIRGTAYPATPAGTYIGLFLGSLPASDGSGSTDSVRVAVTLGSAQQDSNTGRWFTQPNGAVSFTIPANASGEVVGWGVYGASSGGTPVYFDAVPSPFKVSGGQSVMLPASAFPVFAEGTR